MLVSMYMSLEKLRRNKRIYMLSKKGGGTLSYRELQTRYRFKSVKSVYQIISREVVRDGITGIFSKNTHPTKDEYENPDFVPEGVNTIHKWLYKNYGKADRCENKKNCTKKSKYFHWSLLHGKNHARTRDHYWRLCSSCHRKYDGPNGL